ncbi:MAG: phosphoribosylamine--glycine ligase [Candidatus Nanoarchaeia archaeon]|nr:phosphoribosylamine--glycine ligase [Candidatus Nanoarchaeia archaeon]MDD5741267.1 phosphoribosylamine--glycine ligase [Candidatus Nanoarchaeia archaeon]
MPKEDLTVLIIGSGGREHTISTAYEKSPNVKKIVVSPGNDFIAYKREKEVITDKNCSIRDPNSILDVARKYDPDLIDVAQDDALANGAVDILEKNGFVAFGPKKETARIEWDKRWSREFMQRHGISHPQFRYFEDEFTAEQYVEGLYSINPKRVLYVKAAGLCSGKGALKSSSLDEAIRNIRKMKNFPDRAGRVFLIEENLEGEEFSYYAISDGRTYKTFKSAQDNKTVFNFDEGNQTGGMGAVSPAMVTEPLKKEIEKQQISKAINGLFLEQNPFIGILYFGGIVINEKPMNIEYNARWGDPECQVVLPSIENDYLEIVRFCLEGKLNRLDIKQDNKTRVCLVGASRGYPNDYSSVKGKRIFNIDEAFKIEGVNVCGAGIKIVDRKMYANGGRLFNIVAEGRDILEARQKAYSAIALISIEGNNLHYRTDIGWRDVERFNQ